MIHGAFWHESEVRRAVAHVGYRGKTGQDVLNASSSHFDRPGADLGFAGHQLAGCEILGIPA